MDVDSLAFCTDTLWGGSYRRTCPLVMCDELISFSTRRESKVNFRSGIFFKFRFFGKRSDPNEISNVKKKSLKKIKY